MAKRFTDSRKWDDPWFLELENTDRLTWLYLLDKCDHAGIYKHSNKMLTFFIDGANWEEFIEKACGRIKHLENDKYFIPKFIDFQYGELNESVNCHKSVITQLKKLRVDELLIKGCSTLKDKDKDKDKDMVKDMVKDKETKRFRRPTLQQVKEYCKETNSPIDPTLFWNSYESTGWIKANGQPVKNWKATVNTWAQREKSKDTAGKGWNYDSPDKEGRL